MVGTAIANRQLRTTTAAIRCSDKRTVAAEPSRWITNGNASHRASNVAASLNTAFGVSAQAQDASARTTKGANSSGALPATDRAPHVSHSANIATTQMKART